jgi:hypothetical protein
MELDARPVTDCVHHWIIDAPAGAQSGGMCKSCGEARLFRNAMQNDVWRPGYLDFLYRGQIGNDSTGRTDTNPK